MMSFRLDRALKLSCTDLTFLFQMRILVLVIYFLKIICAKHQVLKLTHRMALVFNVYWYVCGLCYL